MDVSFDKFTVSYWTNTQLSTSAAGEFDVNDDGIVDGNFLKHDETTETDIVLDYTTSVGELLSVSVGNIQYNFNIPGNTNELYLGLGLDTILAPVITSYSIHYTKLYEYRVFSIYESCSQCQIYR